jgi:Protein of unknown function (DUF5132)
MDGTGRTLLLGIVAGATGAILGRELAAPLRRLGRPLAKAALTSGMSAVERGRESIALMNEHVADLLAEVAAEREVTLRKIK